MNELRHLCWSNCSFCELCWSICNNNKHLATLANEVQLHLSTSACEFAGLNVMLPTGVRNEIKNFLHYWLHPLLFRQPNNQFAAPIPSYRKRYFNHTEKDVSNITNAIIHIFLLTLSASSNLSSIFFSPFSERWIQCGYDNITYDKKSIIYIQEQIQIQAQSWVGHQQNFSPTMGTCI